MKHLFVLVLAAGLIMAPGIQTASSEDQETAAVAAAENWLEKVDGGKYGESWTETASLFQNAVSPDQWEQSLRAIREPLGRLVSRKLLSKTFHTSLPGAPDGEYVVIQFAASFQHKSQAVETVTPMREKDGTWRVAGYYIR